MRVTHKNTIMLVSIGLLSTGALLVDERSTSAQPAKVTFTINYNKAHFTKAEFYYQDEGTGKRVQIPILPGKTYPFNARTFKHKRISIKIGVRKGIRPKQWIVNGAQHAGGFSKAFYFKSPTSPSNYNIKIVTEGKPQASGKATFAVDYNVAHFTKAEFYYQDEGTGKRVQVPIVPGKTYGFLVNTFKHNRISIKIDVSKGIRPKRWIVNGAQHAGGYSKAFYFKSPTSPSNYKIKIVTEGKSQASGKATFAVDYNVAHFTKAEFYYQDEGTGKRVQVPIVPGKTYGFLVNTFKHNRISIKIDVSKGIRPKRWIVNGAQHAGGYSKAFYFKSPSSPSKYVIKIITEKK